MWYRLGTQRTPRQMGPAISGGCWVGTRSRYCRFGFHHQSCVHQHLRVPRGRPHRETTHLLSNPQDGDWIRRPPLCRSPQRKDPAGLLRWAYQLPSPAVRLSSRTERTVLRRLQSFPGPSSCSSQKNNSHLPTPSQHPAQRFRPKTPPRRFR